MEAFCAEMREYVNKGNPNVRLGCCNCITSWSIDGTTPDRLARLLAENTQPFYRLIGAPYWAAMHSWGHRLGEVIELERMEARRRCDGGIEIFSEGDTFPRPALPRPQASLNASIRRCGRTAPPTGSSNIYLIIRQTRNMKPDTLTPQNEDSSIIPL